jgi:acyl-CoA thioester hydrolase
MNLRELSLEDYPLSTFDKIRYRDIDKQGHVNNAVYSQFFETGRVEYLYNKDHPLTCESSSFVVAANNTEYIKEITWPGTIHIGTGVTKIGNSSLIMVQGLYQDGVLKATNETVVVQMDEDTRKSFPLTKQTREMLTKIVLK